MVQAKRRQPSRSAANRQSFHGLGVLLIGMAIGALATILWQGMQGTDGGVGTGIVELMKESKQADQAETNQIVSEQDTPVTQQTAFEFFTVLPGIEVVVPTRESDSPSTTPPASTEKPVASTAEVADTADTTATATTTAAATTTATDTNAYMLQAGSYKTKTEADRQKANLAFQGLASTIQKISIQDRGDFYRIRLGPYISYDKMVEVDQKLASQKIQTLRLKITKGK